MGLRGQDERVPLEETEMMGPGPPNLFGNRPQQPRSHPAELVDQASRGLFPLGFALCNLAYWLYYLYFTDQDFETIQRLRSGGGSSELHV
jgi:hypothetical protein